MIFGFIKRARSDSFIVGNGRTWPKSHFLKASGGRNAQCYFDDVRSEIEQYKLDNLLAADAQLGWRDENADFRIALRQRIAEIQQTDHSKQQSRSRSVQYIVQLAIALLILALGYWLGRTTN